MRVILLILFFVVSWTQLMAWQEVSCTADALQQERNSRAAAFKSMYQPGQRMQNMRLNNKNLYDIKANAIVFVFWKTDCPYCKNLLSVISDVLLESKATDLQVVAVCVDEGINVWKQHPFVKEQHIHVWNLCDGKGFFGDIAKALHIYATPTMIILDKQYRYLKLPKDVTGLKALIKSLKTGQELRKISSRAIKV